MGDVEHQTLGDVAARAPDRAAVIEAATGRVISFAQLEDRSARLAHAFAAAGIEPAGHVAALLPNVPEYFDIAWATQRSGLYLTATNWHLTKEETSYIVSDCNAQAVLTNEELAPRVPPLPAPGLVVMTGNGLESLIAQSSPEPLRPEVEGAFMFYSSGTTGRPKGISRPWRPTPYGAGIASARAYLNPHYEIDDQTVYLCPAPMYHAAPLGWSIMIQRIGGTVVLMDRFDPLRALEYIERYKVTHVQMVPTMFIRLLKLTEEERSRYDLSSLHRVIHAAAPCPPGVKRQMIEWLGPIVWEYFGTSEGTGTTFISPEEWLARPGSVGRTAIPIHILDDDGHKLPAGEVGTIWFESPVQFEYHNDPSKTAEAFNDRGWSTQGDLGYLDDEGFLYLADRRTDLIVSGGVNIYPSEIEAVLALHPAVSDVAVIGAPDTEMGKRVVAVVLPADLHAAGPELAEELTAYCRKHLAGFKCPRVIDFVDELPRLPTGKLAKRLLMDRYQ